MKFKITDLKGLIIKAGIFALSAGASLYGAYQITPAKQVYVDGGSDLNSSSSEETESSYFNKFAGKITSLLGSDTKEGEEEQEPLALSATFEDFEVTFPTKDGIGMNDIKVEGGLNLTMRNIDDLDFNVDLDVDYNGRTVDLGLALVEKDFYLAFNDFRIKSSYTKTEEAMDYIHNAFFEPENPNGLGINLNLQSVVDEITGKVDLNALLESFADVKVSEVEQGDEVLMTLESESMGLAIEITIGKEDLDIRYVDLGEITFGDVTIKGALSCGHIDEVLRLDDPDYPKQRGEFVEALSYIKWVDDALDLLQSRKLGLQLDAQISLDGETNPVTLADLSTEINFDATNLFDFNGLVIGEDDEDPNVGRPTQGLHPYREEQDDNEEEKDTVEEVLDVLSKLEFGIEVTASGQGEEEYANIDLSYFENAGYLALNENGASDAVMRAKIDNSTISSIAKKVPDMLGALAKNKVSNSVYSKTALREATDDLFSFITSSELVDAIKNGDYSGIIDVIKDIRNDDSSISIKLDLSSLGLGDMAEVSLELDASESESSKVISLDVSNVEIGQANLDVQLSTSEYSDTKINQVKQNKDAYDDMSFVPGIIGQVSDILDTKQAQISLNGSVLDAESKGVTLNGKAQFDFGEKVGYGSLNIRQLDSTLVNKNKYIDHNIDFDINNSAAADTEKNMHFVYNDNVKAKITVQTVTDIIDLATDLLNSDDERFDRFIEPIEEMLVGGAIGSVIENKDYLELAKSSFIKSIKQTNNGNSIEVVIAGDALSLDSDICLKVNMTASGDSKKLDSVELVNFVFSEKTINLKVSLNDFDETYVSPVDKTQNFMDFSQIKVLLDFGINTTKINHYHLKVSASLKLDLLDLISFDADFHIHVDGKNTRVYGSIPKVPWITDFLSADLIVDLKNINSEFVYEPNDDGGLFHMVRNEDHLIGKDEVNYYQADTESFEENLISYLAVDLLNIKSSAIENLSDMSLSSEKTQDPDFSQMFTSTGFKYSYDESTKDNTWNIGLNLGKMLGNDTLQGLELELHGKDQETSGLFTEATVDMVIASVVKVHAKIELVNPNFDEETWPDEIETKYNKVLNWYHGLSSTDKARFDSEYKNQPLKTWRSIEQKRYF